MKAESSANIEQMTFSGSQSLKDLRWYALGLRRIEGTREWGCQLERGIYLYSDQLRVQKNLTCWLFANCKSSVDEKRETIGWVTLSLQLEDAGCRLNIWGDFWGGDWADRYKGILFESPEIKSDLAAAEQAVRCAWRPFNVIGNSGHHSGNMWWNVTIQIADLGCIYSEEFAVKIRESLSSVAEGLAALLKYRIENKGE